MLKTPLKAKLIGKEVLELKINVIGIVGLSLLILFGCSNPTDTGENAGQDNHPDTQPMHYETDKEKRDRQNERPETIGDRGGYPQSDQRDTNASDNQQENSTDPYVDEATDKIYDKISQFKEIKQAQVTATDEKVIVALMLNDYDEETVRNKIVKEVQKVEPNKEVVIYTDDIHWNRVRNSRSRLKSPDGRANGPSIDNE